MNTSEKCFLIVAQTLHMGKAAAMLFTTQQAVSDNIKRLEKEHGVMLFHRRPTLQLTAEGRVLLAGLRRIQLIEDTVRREMKQDYDDTTGTIRFGMGAYRVHDALVGLLLKYQKIHPDIRVDVVHLDTRTLERMLLEGQMDVVIGFNIKEHSELKKEVLVEEEPRVLITERGLNLFFLPKEVRRIKERGLTVEDFEKLPLIANYPAGALWNHYEKAFTRLRIRPRIVASSDDFSEILKLCSANYGGALCPSFLQQVVETYNATDNRFNRLHAVQFPALGWGNTTELAVHKMRAVPPYLEDFIYIAGRYMTVQENG